jgi:hypothetical protein
MTNRLSKLKKRLLQGTKAKCVDGRWSADDLPTPGALIVTGFTRGLQCWKDGELLDELDERDGPLPDVGELNDQIPREERSLGLNGEPEPPWRIVYVVYLVDPETAELYTFINSAWGAQIAYERLTDKLERMTRLRGAGVTAIVKPDCRPMKTKVGPKLRPEFTILEWRDLGGADKQPAQLPPPTDKDPAGVAAAIEQEKQETDDAESPPQAPSNQSAAAAKAPAGKKKKVTVGKPVAPVSREEEFNDRIPDEFI